VLSSSRPKPPEEGTVQKLSRDGVALAYEEAGQGEPTILLVHCWTCDHSFLAPQHRHFAARHRVVNVDLRGHGESDKPKQTYTMAGFADDLAWLCGQLGVEKPVIVGHSMGGNVALEAARRHPDLPRAVVMLDSCIIAPASLRSALASMGEGLRGPEHRDVSKQIVEGVSLATDDARRKAWIAEVMSAAPQFVASSSFDEHILRWDGEQAAAACKVPALYVGAANPLSDVERLCAACPQLVVGQTVGSGHFNNQEVPEQVNAMIERFIATSIVAARSA
jgi:pimeloyl-ACP methyl ester carboxylesterase